MRTLKNRLKEHIKSCYLVLGDDYYLFEKAFSMIKKASNLENPDFNLISFDDDNFSMKAVLDACEVMPLGSEKRVIVLKNLSKVNESDKKALLEYLKNPVETTVLIILDFADKFASIKPNVEFVDAKRMENKLLSGIVVSEISKRGKTISSEALETLIDFCDGYLTRIMNELDKLCFYDMSEELITKNLVEKLVKKENDFVVFELTEALGKRDADKSLMLLSSLVKDVGTLSLITNHFRRLFFISISDLDNAGLANLLGVKEYAISKQRAQVKNFSKMQLKKIYALLEEIDFKIKSGAILSENALYLLVFSILYI